MRAESSARPPGEPLFITLGRWCALGTVAATALGFACGLPFFFFPFGSWYGAIGGAVLGVCGGPVFGLAIGMVDLVARLRDRGDAWRIAVSTGMGAAVSGLVPIVLGFARGHGLDIERHNLAEALFGLTVVVALGAFLGWMVASSRRESPEKKPRNGWSELEL